MNAPPDEPLVKAGGVHECVRAGALKICKLLVFHKTIFEWSV